MSALPVQQIASDSGSQARGPRREGALVALRAFKTRFPKKAATTGSTASVTSVLNLLESISPTTKQSVVPALWVNTRKDLRSKESSKLARFASKIRSQPPLAQKILTLVYVNLGTVSSKPPIIQVHVNSVLQTRSRKQQAMKRAINAWSIQLLP